MPTRSTLTRVMKRILDLGFYGTVAVAIVLAVGLLVTHLLAEPEDHEFELVLPVAIGEGVLTPVVPLTLATLDAGADDANQVSESDEPSQMEVFWDPRVVNGKGELRIHTTRRWLVSAAYSWLLGGLLVVAWVIWLLRRILCSVTGGHPFDRGNVRDMRTISVIVIAMGIVIPVFRYFLGKLILSQIPLAGPQVGPQLDFSGGPIIGGLLLLVLAAIFDHGADLEEEQSLTV